MAVNYRITGRNVTLSTLVNRVILPVADRAMYDLGFHLAREVQDLVSVMGPPRSAPGHPPHIDTGKLILSIAYQYVPQQLRTVVVADTSYAAKLEFGGFTHAFGGVLRWQEPRPFMRRSLYQFATTRNMRRSFRNAMNPNYVYDASLVRHDIV